MSRLPNRVRLWKLEAMLLYHEPLYLGENTRRPIRCVLFILFTFILNQLLNLLKNYVLLLPLGVSNLFSTFVSNISNDTNDVYQLKTHRTIYLIIYMLNLLPMKIFIAGVEISLSCLINTQHDVFILNLNIFLLFVSNLHL